MQEKGIINTNQFVWMLFIIITSFTVMEAPALLLKIAGRDAWLSVIGGWSLDVLLAVVYAYMGIRFQGQNFVQYSITILGKYFGRIVGFAFPVFFLITATALMRILVQLLSTTFLPRTPVELILLIGFIIVGYTARKGIEVMGRVAEILGPIYFISIILLGILLVPDAKIEYLEPQLSHGIYPFLIGSPFVLTFYGICIMMGMFIPLCNKPENGFLAKYIAVSLGTMALGVIVVFSITIFTPELAKNMSSPALMLSRTINILNLFERIEIIWIMVGLGAGIMASTYLIWASSLGISQIIGSQTYKHIVLPLILVSIILGLTTFNNNIERQNFVFYTLPIIGIIVEGGVELFLFVMALILKKRIEKPT